MLHKVQVKLISIVILFITAMPISFSALIVNPSLEIKHSVFVQPILVSDDDGSNTATFFGGASSQSVIKGYVDDIWAQAGIDVDFLDTHQWNNSIANSGTSLPRLASDLEWIIENGERANVTNPNSNVINMFFVNVAAGFSLLSENTAAGLAFVEGNGISQFVGRNLLSFPAGQEAIATVVAHEIGHNLGLFHTNTFDFSEGSKNLMWSGGRTGQLLNSSQITIALESRFSTPLTSVPIPAAVWLFGSALLAMFGYKHQLKTSL
ncbi:MAG TPA: hypothetical protein ENJ32_04220 [Crenotrichaceae bacterium]|nr:hypothetical protein [Crenotrichaceae bacterium]